MQDTQAIAFQCMIRVLVQSLLFLFMWYKYKQHGSEKATELFQAPCMGEVSHQGAHQDEFKVISRP
eukprot:2207362-Amphidinium_carterae.1